MCFSKGIKTKLEPLMYSWMLFFFQCTFAADLCLLFCFFFPFPRWCCSSVKSEEAGDLFWFSFNFHSFHWVIMFSTTVKLFMFIMFSTTVKLFPWTPFCVLVVFLAAKQKPIESLTDWKRIGSKGSVVHSAERLTWGKTWAQVVSATNSIAPHQQSLMNSDRFHPQARHSVSGP